ncbi:MAG TPA: EAL domain-containing protein [Azospirillaceae bacterium]|nr:EAL domain-containing protein [Azospirillaceae bacterium]
MNGLIERYELAEKAGAEGVWDWDLRTDKLYLSPRFLEFLGLEPGEVAHRPEDWLERVHADDIDWLYASFEGQMGDTHLPFQIEHRVRRDKDEWRWLICRGVAVNGHNSEPVRLVGSVADITERKVAEMRLRQSEQRYALAAAASSDGLYDWDLKSDKIYYSPRWKAILGFRDDEIGDNPDEWFDRVVPDDLIWLKATLDAQVEAGGKPFQQEYRIVDGQGEVRWMNCRGIAVLDDHGEPVRVVGSQADITDRKAAEQQLRASEERYALAARGANDGLWDWLLDAGEVYYSPRWKEMLGCSESDVGVSPGEWFNRVVLEDRAGLKAAIDLHLEGSRDHLEHEFRMRHETGSEMWFLVRGLAVRDEEDRAVRIAGSMTDITARKSAERQLLFDAFHDGLTGLPNRTLVTDRIAQALNRQRNGGGRHFAVLLFDLDRFKTINDSLGGMYGDQMLLTTAKRLEEAKRTGDTVARLSADEFCLLLEAIDDVPDTVSVAQAMAEAVAHPVTLANQEVLLTASIGIAHSASDYERADDMLRDASLAMVRAKSSGRARIEVFDTALRENAMKSLRTEIDLRSAMELGQLELFYQPIVELGSRTIAGFEALMRWHHPERGMIPPVEFIPLAEESGLIIPMGRWALQESARQIAEWQRLFPRKVPLFMSVNASSQQFRDDDILARIKEVLADHPIPPSSLKIEITESMLMQDPSQVEQIMRDIRALDVKLSIDDFGTGYSSLSYLHKFPLNTLKIDKSFVSAIGQGGDNAAIVHVIATLAAVLRLDVVAEGIEVEEEAQFLQDVNCKYGQGYLFARPQPAAVVTELLAKEQVMLVEMTKG